MNQTIIQATTIDDLHVIRQLCHEYADWMGADLEGTQNFSREMAELPGAYGPPAGRLLLARVEGQPAGCVALKRLSDGVCEMKRLYVRPEFRKLGLGRALIEQLLAEARSLGYGIMRLDTLPQQMGPAVALYRALGFVPIPPYWNNVLPGVEYMELKLSD